MKKKHLQLFFAAILIMGIYAWRYESSRRVFYCESSLNKIIKKVYSKKIQKIIIWGMEESSYRCEIHFQDNEKLKCLFSQGLGGKVLEDACARGVQVEVKYYDHWFWLKSGSFYLFFIFVFYWLGMLCREKLRIRSVFNSWSNEVKNRKQLHATGQAVLAYLLQDEYFPLEYVTIFPNKDRQFLSFKMPRQPLLTKKNLINEMIILFGGRVAEEFYVNKNLTMTNKKELQNSISFEGAQDLKKIKKIAKKIILEYGLGERIYVVLSSQGESQKDLMQEIQEIINRAYKKAKEILSANKDFLREVQAELILSSRIKVADIQRVEDYIKRNQLPFQS